MVAAGVAVAAAVAAAAAAAVAAAVAAVAAAPAAVVGASYCMGPLFDDVKLDTIFWVGGGIGEAPCPSTHLHLFGWGQ